MWIVVGLGLMWATVFVAVPLLFRRNVRDDLPPELTSAAAPRDAFPVQVLFAEVLPKHVTVDCVLMAQVGSREAGSPFTLRINRPDHPALDGAMTGTLCELAERLAKVDLRFLVREGEPQVRIARNQTAMTFDLGADAAA